MGFPDGQFFLLYVFQLFGLHLNNGNNKKNIWAIFMGFPYAQFLLLYVLQLYGIHLNKENNREKHMGHSYGISR